MATTTEQQKKQNVNEDNENKNMKDKAKETASNIGEKAKQAGTYARDRADDAVTSAGKGAENLAETMREKGPHSGMFGRANEAVASTIDRTGQYLEEKGLSGMAEDMTEMIRRNPIPAVLIGIGVGFVLARLTSSSRS